MRVSFEVFFLTMVFRKRLSWSAPLAYSWRLSGSRLSWLAF
jgi:hypothetical protein